MEPDTGKKLLTAPVARVASIVASGFAVLFLCGCLYTTHHFNSGRILEPGRTEVTFGLGRKKLYEQDCPDGTYKLKEGGRVRCSADYDPASSGVDTQSVPSRIRSYTIPKFSLSYRLGVRGAWGPFTGVELGWLLEAPTNPGTAEFDLKLGLPQPDRSHFRHSVSAGWGVGMWADNSYFAEYALSYAFGRQILFANYRYTYLATQPAELDSAFDNWKFTSHQRSIHQTAFGINVKMPDLILVPDYFIPQIIFTSPVVAPFVTVPSDELESVLVHFNLGFGWSFR